MQFLSFFVELARGQFLPTLQFVFEPETGFHPLDGERSWPAFPGQDVMTHACRATPFKVPSGLAKNMGAAFRAGIGLVMDEERLGSVIGVFLDEEARAGGSDERLGAHTPIEHLGNILAPFGGVAATEDHTVILFSELPEGTEQRGDDVGTIRIDFAAQDGLDGVNVDETGTQALHILRQEGQIREGKWVWFVVFIRPFIDKSDFAQVSAAFFQAWDNDGP
jgi:hypothetical protein